MREGPMDKKTRKIQMLVEDYGMAQKDALELVDYEMKHERDFAAACQQFKDDLRRKIQDAQRHKLAEIIGRRH